MSSIGLPGFAAASDNPKNNAEAPQQMEFDVLFMVGTHHLPFTRLLIWAAQYAAEHPELRIGFQSGETPTPPDLQIPANLELVTSFTRLEMEQMHTRQVVLPAGPSLMMEWIRRDHRPILVPRNPEKGEHIDEHQQLFARQMGQLGIVDVVNEYVKLCELLGALDNQKLKANPKASPQLPSQLTSTEISAQNFADFVQLVCAGPKKRRVFLT